MPLLLHGSQLFGIEAVLVQPLQHAWFNPPQVCVGTQRCDALQVLFGGQSALVLQPQVPFTQAWPLALFVQSWHVPPPLPQAEPDVPATHWPPLQQPLWQYGRVEQQVVFSVRAAPGSAVAPQGVTGTQTWFWQMVLAGQSPGTLQPQTPLTQAVPFGLPWQFTHVPPPLPHAVNDVPATQLPPLQQPVVHG